MSTVTLTQFIHPYGKCQETSIELPDEVCEMAKQQVLSCEMMPNDYSKIVFYSRKKEWDEEDEEVMFATVLKDLIRLVNTKHNSIENH